MTPTAADIKAQVLEYLPPHIREAARARAQEEAAENAKRIAAGASFREAETERVALAKQWHEAARTYRGAYIALRDAQAKLAEIADEDRQLLWTQQASCGVLGQRGDIAPSLPYLGVDVAALDCPYLNEVDRILEEVGK